MSSFMQALDTLQRAYSKQGAEDTLNTAMRRALRQHAAAERLEFRQDSVGNVYINKQGRDNDLGGIALVFPIDEHESAQLFIGAFTVFNQLASEDLLCAITLMGCTSSKQGSIGLEMWAESTGASAKSATPSPQLDMLKQFSSLPRPSDFVFSALFEISDATSEALKLNGSFILVAQAQKSGLGLDGVTTHVRDFPRAPRLLIDGNKAKVVATTSIRGYSEYIAALFDNFD